MLRKRTFERDGKTGSGSTWPVSKGGSVQRLGGAAAQVRSPWGSCLGLRSSYDMGWSQHMTKEMWSRSFRRKLGKYHGDRCKSASLVLLFQAEDSAPPRPPLPRLYDYEETPPEVPPLPKEASVIRHTSVRGLKRQSDERKRDRESGQYVTNGDGKVRLSLMWTFLVHRGTMFNTLLLQTPVSDLSVFRPTCGRTWVNLSCQESVTTTLALRSTTSISPAKVCEVGNMT